MASIYNEKRMYTNPITFIIMIPIGVVILLFLANFFIEWYQEFKIDRDVKEIFKETLDHENFETLDEYEEYIRTKFEEKGYEDEEVEISLSEKDDYKLLVVYANYYSLKNQIFNSGRKLTVVRYKGYYNEYKETVIEKYDEDEDDDLIEDIDTTETTTINPEDDWDEPTE